MNYPNPGCPYSGNYYPVQTVQRLRQPDVGVLLDAAKTGVIVGSAGAAAANLLRMRQQEIVWQQALSNTLKTGLSVGVATTAATAVGQVFAQKPLLSLAATLLTGTAVMYALNNLQQEKDNE